MKLKQTLVVLTALVFAFSCKSSSDSQQSSSKENQNSQTQSEPKQPVDKQAAPNLKARNGDKGDKNRNPSRRSRSSSPSKAKKKPIPVAEHYDLYDLKLTAVVTGKVRPTAMFSNPDGRGYIVHRGQRIGKTRARVKRILDNRVVVEMPPKARGAKRTKKVLVLAKNRPNKSKGSWRYSGRRRRR